MINKIIAVGLEANTARAITEKLSSKNIELAQLPDIKNTVNFIQKSKFSLLLLHRKKYNAEQCRELCLFIKSQPKIAQIPIIFLVDTQDADENEKLQFLNASLINEYIILPAPVEEIIARINVFLELRMLQEELEIKNALLEKISITDELTKIYNRRHIIERLSEEIAKTKRYEYWVSCLLVDLDYFKKINDNFGHQAGDEALKQLAALLKTNIRSVDIIGRYGGEEFLIILPFTDKEKAVIAAERLRRLVQSKKFPIADKSIDFTLSIGATSFCKSNNTDIDVEKVIKIIDGQLYKAKQNGRNKIFSQNILLIHKFYTLRYRPVLSFSVGV